MEKLEFEPRLWTCKASYHHYSALTNFIFVLGNVPFLVSRALQHSVIRHRGSVTDLYCQTVAFDLYNDEVT